MLRGGKTGSARHATAEIPHRRHDSDRWMECLAPLTLVVIGVGFLALLSRFERKHVGTLAAGCLVAALAGAVAVGQWSSVSRAFRIAAGSVLSTELVGFLVGASAIGAVATSVEAAAAFATIAGYALWRLVRREGVIAVRAGGILFSSVAGTMVVAATIDMWQRKWAADCAFGSWLGLVLSLVLFGVGRWSTLGRPASTGSKR